MTPVTLTQYPGLLGGAAHLVAPATTLRRQARRRPASARPARGYLRPTARDLAEIARAEVTIARLEALLDDPFADEILADDAGLCAEDDRELR